MDLETFEDHLDRYGGNVARWPASVRDDAADCVKALAPARKALRAMRDVEAVLVSTAAVASDVDSFASTATRHRQIAQSRRMVAGTGWGVAAAIVLVLGYSIGDLTPVQHDENPDQVFATALESPSAVDVD